jgi:hypothetical protein
LPIGVVGDVVAVVRQGICRAPGVEGSDLDIGDAHHNEIEGFHSYNMHKGFTYKKIDTFPTHLGDNWGEALD